MDIVLPLLKKGDYIEGSFVKSAHCNGFINDGNPGDRADKIGRFPFSIHNAKEAVQFANAAQINWQERGFESRLQSVHSYIGQLESRLPYLTNVLTREVGLPTWEARQEVLDTKKYIEQLISAAAQMYNSQNLEQIDHDPMALQYNQPIYCPLGTLAVLTPFSLALQTPSVYTCAALLTGNTVVHKPSKYTPGVGQAVAELWDRCQLPRGVYNMIQGPGSHIGHYLIGNKSIDGTLFAGSHSTVQDISSKLELPPHYPLICQLGGKSSAIVLEDADLESTARALLAGAYRMTGQRPTSIARVFVSSVIANVLIDVLAKSIDQIEVGYGEDSTAYLGPMISDHWRTRFHRYGHTLFSNGHTPIRETENIDNLRRGFYVKPAMYNISWTNGAPMLHGEPPGPLLMIYEVQDVNEAISLHNQCDFRRMTSLFTSPDNLSLKEICSQLQTGAIYLNQAPAETMDPLGFYGHSNNSSTYGTDLIRAITRRKFVYSPT